LWRGRCNALVELVDGEITPGEKLRGQVGFQIPEDAQGLTFVFDADVFGHGKVFVALQ
jgi:hypothetical protein